MALTRNRNHKPQTFDRPSETPSHTGPFFSCRLISRHSVRFNFRFLILLLLCGRTSVALSQSQNLTIDGGAMGLAQALDRLPLTSRVMLIAAHPDDEDTELLTYLVRHEGAEAAYLSLSRGEGGQNLIGPELGEALGLIRSEELLGARRLDGARQYFTRAFDFGYSKTLA